MHIGIDANPSVVHEPPGKDKPPREIVLSRRGPVKPMNMEARTASSGIALSCAENDGPVAVQS